jgi:hypothetical protein
MTKQKWELLTDYDKALMIERGIRGGISQCSNRYARENNKYMNEKYDKSKESVFIEYLDANNLYRWAMRKYVTYGNFKWSKTDIDVLNIPDDFQKDIFLKWICCTQKNYMIIIRIFRWRQKIKIYQNSKYIYDKEKYFIHYITLKIYLKMGLKLKKVTEF